MRTRRGSWDCRDCGGRQGSAGVIGIGNIVRTTMAPAMVAEPACDLVAAVSRDQGRADEFAREFGARFAYTSYDEMLANPEVDAVFIATPMCSMPTR